MKKGMKTKTILMEPTSEFRSREREEHPTKLHRTKGCEQSVTAIVPET